MAHVSVAALFARLPTLCFQALSHVNSYSILLLFFSILQVIVQITQRSNMTFLKRLLSKHGERKQDAQPCIETLPHLHSKSKPSKKNLEVVGKSYPLILLFHKINDSALPRIILRPATPPEGPAFERSGSNFVLRESKSATRAVVGHLQVPQRKKRARRRASLPPTESLQAHSEDTRDIDVYLDAECGADYRRYLAGLD
jgi:hypothetical protein